MLEKDPKKRISPSDILIHPYFKENIFLPKIDLNSDSFENSNVIQTTDSVSTNSIESKPDQKETENTIQLIKNDHHCHSPCVDTEIKNTKLNGKMKIKVYRFQACDFTIPINHQN